MCARVTNENERQVLRRQAQTNVCNKQFRVRIPGECSALCCDCISLTTCELCDASQGDAEETNIRSEREREGERVSEENDE